MTDKKTLPEPSGIEVPPKDWQHIFLRIKKDSSKFNVYDGTTDMETVLLQLGKVKKKYITLIVDDLVPNLADRIVKEKAQLLVRAHYYQGGLYHRISFNTKILKKIMFKGSSGLELKVLTPLRRVSNLFVAFPTDDKPVYLEIPVEGAPPDIRVTDVSVERMRAFSPRLNKLVSKNQQIDGINVQFVDLGETVVSGKVSPDGEDEIVIDFDPIPREANRMFDDFLKEEFTSKHKPEPISPEKKANLLPKSRNKSIAKISPTTAMIILDDRDLRHRFETILNGFNWKCFTSESFDTNKWKTSQYHVGLFVLDVRNEDFHAVDLLHELKRNQAAVQMRFIIVGSDQFEARQEEWSNLGKGLFIRSQLPYNSLKKMLAEWLKIKEAPSGPSIPEDRPLILVVDDESEIIDLVSNLLAQHNYNVLIATNGEEALQMTRKSNPDLILLDIDLPELSGLDALRVMRSHPKMKDKPVIMMTGYREKERIETALSLGISDYLAKPFDGDTLISRIEKALDKGG